jgi:hypothetical protein
MGYGMGGVIIHQFSSSMHEMSITLLSVNNIYINRSEILIRNNPVLESYSSVNDETRSFLRGFIHNESGFNPSM